MPIEIRELHIRINVENQAQTNEPTKIQKEEKDRLVAACVEQVMDLQAQKRER
ncbi:MAG: DUF5908 family protein [Mangrovibacterium sp.]